MHKPIFILFCCLLISCKKDRTGILVTDLTVNTSASFNKVRFIGDNAVIVGGRQYDEALIYMLKPDNTLVKSDLPANISNKEIYGIDISPQGKIMSVGYEASVIVSSDSGAHWHFTQNGTWKDFHDIDFRDEDTAFVVSHRQFAEGGLALLHHSGAGENFLSEERNFAIDDIDFLNSMTGYLCGYGALMKTTDGGHTWTFTTAKNDYFKSMSWRNELEGIAVGYAGSIIKTADGGSSWETSRNGNNFLKKKIHFLAIENNGEDAYMAVGEKGFVCISYDQGASWQEVKKFTDKDLKGLYFRNTNECVVVGEEGGLFLLKI